MINGLSYVQVPSVFTVYTASAFLEENEMISLVLSVELKLRRECSDLPMILNLCFTIMVAQMLHNTSLQL